MEDKKNNKTFTQTDIIENYKLRGFRMILDGMILVLNSIRKPETDNIKTINRWLGSVHVVLGRDVSLEDIKNEIDSSFGFIERYTLYDKRNRLTHSNELYNVERTNELLRYRIKSLEDLLSKIPTRFYE